MASGAETPEINARLLDFRRRTTKSFMESPLPKEVFMETSVRSEPEVTGPRQERWGHDPVLSHLQYEGKVPENWPTSTPALSEPEERNRARLCFPGID